MPEDFIVHTGKYRVRKRFRHTEVERHKKDMPWSKKILDLDQRKFFSRTTLGWSRIVGFYLVLYGLICLILFFMILIFFAAYNKYEKPLWLKGAPGISMVPKGSSITFNRNIINEIYPYTDQIIDFLDKFDGSSTKIFANFSTDKQWGYTHGKPCVFIKLNKVIGYKAKTYDDIKNLPKGFPSDLKEELENYGTGKIWLTCEPSGAKFKFLPGPYFDTYTDLNDVNRVIAVQINGLDLNKKMAVTCKVWADNIDIDEKFNGWGNIKFEITMYGS